MSSIFHSVLRAVASALEIPVTIVLVFFLAFAVYSVGWLLAEFFTERRKMKADVPALLEAMRNPEADLARVIIKGGLIRRQRTMLLELTHHPELSPAMRAALRDNLLEAEQSRYDRTLKLTDMAARLAPMFGLLGTLIPLGPGIIALGTGNTAMLSANLTTAFDTTIAGLVAAAILLVVSGIRRRWYNGYMNDLETLAACISEAEENRRHE